MLVHELSARINPISIHFFCFCFLRILFWLSRFHHLYSSSLPFDWGNSVALLALFHSIPVRHGLREPPRPPSSPRVHASRARVCRYPATTVGSCRRSSHSRRSREFTALRGAERGSSRGVLCADGGRAPSEAAPGPQRAAQTSASGDGSRR